MIKLIADVLADFSHDTTLLRLDIVWRYGPLWRLTRLFVRDLRDIAIQAIVNWIDYLGDRGNRVCDWLVPSRYR